MATLEYRKQLPSEEGWYRRKRADSDTSRFVYVHKNYGNGSFYLNKFAPQIPIRDDGTLWAGPYPEPAHPVAAGEAKEHSDNE